MCEWAILPLFPFFFLRPGWSIIPVLWVSSLTVNLSVQQTDGAAPRLIRKVRAAKHTVTQTFKRFHYQSVFQTLYKHPNDNDGHSVLPACSPGSIVCSTACAEEADVSQCASSAVNGFKSWSSLSCNQRAKVLLRSNKHTFTPPALFLSHQFNTQMNFCPLTGWWASSGSTASVSQSCVSSVRPPAPPPPCSGCCSSTAAGRSSETHSSLTGHLWVSEFSCRYKVLSVFLLCCFLILLLFYPPGVVAVVTSRDCPLYSLLLKVLPALAMGKTHTDVCSWSLTWL